MKITFKHPDEILDFVNTVSKYEFDMDMKKLSVVLAALSNSGSLPCFTVQFTVKDKNKVQEELLYKAAENARKKSGNSRRRFRRQAGGTREN